MSFTTLLIVLAIGMLCPVLAQRFMPTAYSYVTKFVNFVTLLKTADPAKEATPPADESPTPK